MFLNKIVTSILLFLSFNLTGQQIVNYVAQADVESALLSSITSTGPTFGIAVRGISNSASGIGLYGQAVTALRGDGDVTGVEGRAPVAIWGIQSAGGTLAGDFDGNVDVSGTFTNPSDLKLKTIFKNTELALPKILLLKPTAYKYKTDLYPMMNLRKGNQFGFIAQEIEAIFPHMVSDLERPQVLSDKGKVIAEKVTYKAVNYIDMIPVLTQGIQELNAALESQKEIIAALKKEIENLKSEK